MWKMFFKIATILSCIYWSKIYSNININISQAWRRGKWKGGTWRWESNDSQNASFLSPPPHHIFLKDHFPLLSVSILDYKIFGHFVVFALRYCNFIHFVDHASMSFHSWGFIHHSFTYFQHHSNNKSIN